MENAFRQAIINSLMIKKFDPLLQDLVDRVWAAVEDGTFTENLDQFKADAAALGADMNAALAPFLEAFLILGIKHKRQAKMHSQQCLRIQGTS